MRKLGWLVLGLLALLLVGLLAAGVWLRSASPQVDGDIALEGLHGDVEIWRDALGVPHVFASDEHDLHFALGVLHAQDRLWQMELVARVAQGRLAEAIGAGLLESDRFLRTLGIWRAAQDQERSMDADALAPLQAYADGVNAFLAARTGALPPEFLALGIEPQAWTPLHSLAIEKVMAWDLALYGDAADASRAVARLGLDTVAKLLQPYPEWGPTILEGQVPEIPEPVALLLDAFSTAKASNAWVVGGSRTVSGRPILANDMHLAARAPALWYLAALHGGDVVVAGNTLPGVPWVIAGHTESAAWGFTNAMVDDVDFFLVQADSADASLYWTADGTEPFRVAQETIEVKDGEPVSLPVRLTRWGPVLSLGGGQDVAMRWATHDPSRSFEAFARFNRARTAADVLAAVPLFDNPHQNVVFADTTGAFGYAMGGRIPRRKAGVRPPTLPVPGWTGEWEWDGYHPFEDHPSVLNPPSGYVVTANNRQAAGPLGDRISSDWESPFRAERIRTMILETDRIDAEAVHRMQLDVHDAFADRYLDRAVEAFGAAGLPEAAATLSGWDRRVSADSRAAALFLVWYERIRAGVRRDLYQAETGWLPRDATDEILETRTLAWGEDGTQRYAAIAERAAAEADSIVGVGVWGDLHRAVQPHVLSASRLLDRLLGLDVGPAPAPGSPTTVNVSHYGGAFPVRATAGASQRHVADLGNIDGAGGFILPTGQSGVPFSPHYRDQFERWLDGGLWPVPLNRDRAVAGGVHHLVLRPGVGS